MHWGWWSGRWRPEFQPLSALAHLHSPHTGILLELTPALMKCERWASRPNVVFGICLHFWLFLTLRKRPILKIHWHPFGQFNFNIKSGCLLRSAEARVASRDLISWTYCLTRQVCYSNKCTIAIWIWKSLNSVLYDWVDKFNPEMNIPARIMSECWYGEPKARLPALRYFHIRQSGSIFGP